MSASASLQPTSGPLLQLNHSVAEVYPPISPKVNTKEADRPPRMNLVEAAVSNEAPVQLTVAYVFMTLVSTMYMLQ
jgi:hypothetical protein